jgi:hypothetical protein
LTASSIKPEEHGGPWALIAASMDILEFFEISRKMLLN